MGIVIFEGYLDFSKSLDMLSHNFLIARNEKWTNDYIDWVNILHIMNPKRN